MNRLFSIALVVCGASLLFVGDAGAQCGAIRSSCTDCHDGAKAPLPGRDPWHEQHAFADVCAACHGGKGDAQDAAQAHVGLLSPLRNIDVQCGFCHGANARTLAQGYLLRDANRSDAGAPLSGVATNPLPPIQHASPVVHAHGSRLPNLILLTTTLVIALAAFRFVVHHERSRNRAS